ncbi:MAG: condensation domain-containing protein [Verrucomicrobiota bacterium]
MFKTETTTTMLSDLPPAAEPASGGAGEEFVMPCAVSQQRFWVLDQLVSGNSALNIPLAVELKGPLEVEALDQALQLLIQRHETLRTTFAWIEDEVRQVITPVVPFHLQQKDLGGVAADAREETILKEMEAEAVRPLSLTQAPIFRARLLRLHDEHHVLLLTLHHIICDGWSNGVAGARDRPALPRRPCRASPRRCPSCRSQYADYVLWQRDWLQTEDFRSQLDYWEQQWNGSMRALDFPSDHPRKVGRMYPSTIESLLLPGPLTERIKQRCNELDVTIFMIFFAMYVVLLNRYSGQARFMVGTTAANRTRPELENLIGQFANPMLLPCDVSDGPTFRELLFRVREQSLDAVSRQEVPFESIIEKFESVSGRAREAGHPGPLPFPEGVHAPGAVRRALDPAAALGQPRHDLRANVRHRGARRGARACRWSTTPRCSRRRASRGCCATSKTCSSSRSTTSTRRWAKSRC